MFGLFKKECVVNENDKKWIEDSLAWLYYSLGKENFLKFETVSPEIFKEGIGKTRSQFADILFQKIQTSFAIPLEGFQINYHSNPDWEVDGVGAIVGSVGSGKIFSGISTVEGGKLNVTVEEKALKNLDKLASLFSYFLSLHKLKRQFKLQNVSGYHAEIGAIVFGSGMFISNAIITHEKWSGSRMYGWSVGQRGYLTQQMAGYAFALLAHIKGNADKTATEFLCPDVKNYYKETIKFINQEKLYYSEYINFLDENRIQVGPDYCYEKKEYYDHKILRSISKMKNGWKHGLTKYYHRNGEPWSEWEFKDNIPWNAFFNHDQRGEPVEKGTLTNGSGTLFSYSDEGELEYVFHFENGKLINTEKFKVSVDELQPD
jgi:hypothetical protein